MENSPRILIVDDEAIIRDVLKGALQAEGYILEEADCGKAALELIEKTSFDVVITDITMAQMSGIDLLFAIKERSPETEVILITAYASLETAEAAVAGKAYRYLRKPFDDIDDIIEVVSEALHSQNRRKKKEAQFQELISQRDRLRKQLGQLETMYSISHACGFPEDPASLMTEIATLLSKEIPLDILACSIVSHDKAIEDFGRLVVIFLSPFQDNIEKYIIKILQEELEEDCKTHIIKNFIHSYNSVAAKRLGKLIEITFPKRSSVNGMMYVGFAKKYQLSKSEAQLLEVVVAQIAGAIGKLIEFRYRERKHQKQLIDGMVDGVLLFKGNKTDIINHAAFRLLDVKQEKDLQEKLESLGLMQRIENIRQGNWTIDKKIEFNDKILSTTILPARNIWGENYTMVLRDVTEKTRMQLELERTRKLSSVGELAAGVVHELNTPLTVVLGYSQLCLDLELEKNLEEDIRKIYGEAQRCQKIVQNLLDLAPSKHKQRLPTNVKDLVERVLVLKKYSLHKKKIRMIRKYPEENIWVTVDPGQIQQVLLNIINNAEEAMEEETEKELGITLFVLEEKVYIEIADTGPGVSSKARDQIFDPFFTTKPPGKGTGIGLSISHKILREHDGRILCKNASEKGAIFIIELPMSEQKVLKR